MSTQVDAAVRRCVAEDGAPSASVAVVFDGQVVYSKAFGKASLLPSVAASASTRYQLASLSKTFTAEAVLLLAAEGKLSLSDPVSTWYPLLTESPHVTLRQLLSHTAGYPDHYPQSYPAGPRTKMADPDRIIGEWGRHPLLFEPGTAFRYSNLDYEIAGCIVEKVSGEPLFRFMQDRIFKPLGMSSVLDLDTIPANSSLLATGYVRTVFAPLRPAPYEGPGWSFGAGQVVATAEDVARWDAAFMDHRLLPEPQATEEVTPVPLTTGRAAPTALGLFVQNQDGVIHYYHTGQGLGFEAINLIYPSSKMAIVVLSNTNVTAINVKLGYEIGYLLQQPTPNERFARDLFIGLQKGNPDTSRFTDDLKQYLSPSVLADFKSSLRPLGPIRSLMLLRSQVTDGLESRDYRLIAGGRSLDLHLLLTADGKVEDVTVVGGVRP